MRTEKEINERIKATEEQLGAAQQAECHDWAYRWALELNLLRWVKGK